MNTKEKMCCLHHIPLFQQLSEKEYQHILRLLHHQQFKKGDIIFSPDTKEQLLIVSSGKMKVYKLNRLGKEQFIRMVGRGAYEGENYLFGCENANLYGEATTDMVICALYESDFKTLLNTYPQINLKFLDLNAQKTIELGIQTELLSIDKIEESLALYLARLSHTDKALEPQHIKIPIPLKELASYLGTSPETLSRKLRDFEKKNWIKRQQKEITILSPFWSFF